MTATPHASNLAATAAAEEKDHFDAFAPGPRARRAPSGAGVLSGLDFTVQDLIDVAGAPTGAGVPDWACASRPAETDAAVVAACLAAGAALTGKTATDELGFSLEGSASRYPAPRNPRDAGALCGGSASGAAAATAGGLCDFALGVDTGGSVRIPAAFCGLWAMRPSHGRIPLDGVMPLAPSYDTIGWMARDAETLRRVALALLGPAPEGAEEAGRAAAVSVAEDVLEVVTAEVAESLRAACAGRAAAPPARMFPGLWQDHFRVYTANQALEMCEGLGQEVARRSPKLTALGQQRMANALAVEKAVARSWDGFRRAARSWFDLQVPPGRVIALPTAPVARLPRDLAGDAPEVAEFYGRALALSAVAGAVGAPQVQMPLATGGLSLIGRPGEDFALIAAARAFAGV